MAEKGRLAQNDPASARHFSACVAARGSPSGTPRGASAPVTAEPTRCAPAGDPDSGNGDGAGAADPSAYPPSVPAGAHTAGSRGAGPTGPGSHAGERAG